MPPGVSPWDDGSLPKPMIPLQRTFEGYLGLKWLSITDESAHVSFEVREGLQQPLGLVHGGVYAAVAETVASIATVRVVWRDGFAASGLSNSASFLRPVTEGHVDVHARCRHRSHGEWIWSHDFRDAEARLCALVDVTIAVRALR